MKSYPFLPNMVQAITVLTVLKMMTKAQTSCGSGSVNGKVMYERLPNTQLQGFDDDVVRDTAPPFMVLEKCQDLCMRDRASNNIVRTCTSFDFQPGSRLANYNGGPEYEESTCYLTREQAAPEGIGNLMLVPNSVHFTEVCISSNRPDRECPNRRYIFERHPRKKLKLPTADMKEMTASNRSECEDQCLNEFSFVCRSATYDSAMRTCTLSRFTRRTHPELLQDDPSSDYLENTCLNAERRCDGLGVFIKEETKRLGGPFEVDLLSNVTLEICQTMCVQAEKYFCRSLEYDETTKQCSLSEEDSISQKDDLGSSSSPSHHFYDFACLDSPRGSEYPDNSVTSHLFTGKRPDTAFQRFRNSRLGGEHHSEISGRSLSECLDECLRQPSFQCRSAVYSERYRTCRLSRFNQRDGMRIIYDADYDYYENLMLGGDGEGTGSQRPSEGGSYRPEEHYPSPGPYRPGGGGRYPPGGERPPPNRYPFDRYPDRHPGGGYKDRYPSYPDDRYPPKDRYPLRPVDEYPSGGGRYPAGPSRYPGGDRYPPEGHRYPTGGDRYPPGGDRYPPSGGTDGYPGRYPDRNYPPSGNGIDYYDERRYGNRYGGSYGGSYGGYGGRYGGSDDRFGGYGGNRYNFEEEGYIKPARKPARPFDRYPPERPYDDRRPPYDDRRPSGRPFDRPPYDQRRPLSPGPDGPIYDGWGAGATGAGGPSRPIGYKCDEGESFKQSGAHQRLRKQFIRRFATVRSLLDCQRECAESRDFVCRSFNYREGGTFEDRDNCELSDRDTRELELNSPQFFDSTGSFDYYERAGRQGADCLDVSQVCNEDGMEFSLTTPEGFYGRIYAYGFYDSCFTRGNGAARHVLRISGPQGYPECGTQRYGDTMTNIVVVQFSDFVQTGMDKRFNLTCLFRGPGEAVVYSDYIGAGSGSPIPIEYLPAENTLSSKVRLMILYQGRPTTTIAVGDPLTFRLEAQDGYNYVTDIFASNVIARDPYSGRSVQLIDRSGCPVDPYVFPALDHARNGDTLEARFNAFKLPQANFLIFEATVHTCKGECKPAFCKNGYEREEPSFGRRKREINSTETITGETNSTATGEDEDEETEFVREMIEVFESRDELQQEARRAVPVQESVCLTSGEYKGMLSAIFVLFSILLIVMAMAGVVYNKYWSTIRKNIVADRHSSASSYPNTRSSGLSSLSIFGAGLQRPFPGLSKQRPFPPFPKDDADLPNPGSGGPFEDPSEPIYTDPSLFERSRSLRSIAISQKRKQSPGPDHHI